jgi:hypothetical protein
MNKSMGITPEQKNIEVQNLTWSALCKKCHMQSLKLGGSPKPVACKIVHGRIK